MQKNKRWFVLPLLLILVVPLFCIPAAAAGVNSNAKFSPIFWDVVQLGDQFVEFAGNVVSDQAYLDVTSPALSQVVSADTSLMAAEVDFRSNYNSRQLTLTATSFILKASDFKNLIFTTFGQTYSLRITWTANIIEWNLYNDRWVPSTIFVSGGTSATTYSDIAPLILRDFQNAVDSRYYFVANLSVVVTVQADEFNDDWIVMQYNLSDNFNNFPGYGLSLHLPYKKEVVVDPANPNDVSFVDWLKVAVGGFLDFELWPGFTLNQLVEFVVVIGLVLWFITLLI